MTSSEATVDQGCPSPAAAATVVQIDQHKPAIETNSTGSRLLEQPFPTAPTMQSQAAEDVVAGQSSANLAARVAHPCVGERAEPLAFEPPPVTAVLKIELQDLEEYRTVPAGACVRVDLGTCRYPSSRDLQKLGHTVFGAGRVQIEGTHGPAVEETVRYLREWLAQRAAS